MAIYDISLPVDERLAGWPGDAPYRFTWTCRLSGGASVNLGEVGMSIHTGTHADAPFHYCDSGPTIDAVELDAYVGPAVVADVRGIERISAGGLETAIRGARPERILLKTGAWTDHSRFPDAIPTITDEAIDWLAARGARLLGLDLPSVDALDNKELPNHHALGRHGIAILESLDLSAVEPGMYELVALPLRLVGADGSPVRAILRTLART